MTKLLEPYSLEEYQARLKVHTDTAQVKAWLEGTWEMSTVDDRSKLDTTIVPGGQQANYLVLSDEERAKGFVRPVRLVYQHEKCGTTTRMGRTIAETYARQPDFYGGTFCSHCCAHFPVGAEGEFTWWPEGGKVGT